MAPTRKYDTRSLQVNHGGFGDNLAVWQKAGQVTKGW